MKIVRKISKEFLDSTRISLPSARIQNKVAKIVSDVANRGDEALLEYTKRFDKVLLTPKQLKVSEAEISAAYQGVDPKMVAHFRAIFENIRAFYKKQLQKSWKVKDKDGALVGEKIVPLDRVGVYVPGGQAPLVSSVYMAVIPAKVAGVKEIYIASPPDKEGRINPYILVVANLLKVSGIFKMGGAQAIAAFAYGTKAIPKVDKIVGPGNQYVTEAKRQVFGIADIDLLAGPSEVVIVANQHTPAEYVVADLKAQAEHVGGTAILLTSSKRLAKYVRKALPKLKGYIMVVSNLDGAIEIANRIAPEHLQIMVKSPQRYLKSVKNTGAVFLGEYTPTALGDYVAGPSHILPTGGTAKMFSGLSLDDFTKRIHLISYGKRALERVRCPVQAIASIEGLQEHLNSVKVRK